MVLPLMAAVSGILDLIFKQTTYQATQLSIQQFLYIWFTQGWSWWLLIGPIFLIFLLYPSGHFLSQKWRWAVALIVADFALFLIIVTFARTIDTETGQSWANPIGFLPDDVLGLLLGIMSAMLLANTVISFVAVFIRCRRSQAIERAQIRWLFFACVIFFVVYAFSFISQFEDSFLLNILFVLSIMTIPVSIGIAVLRYRLWDIDFVINRSLVYVSLPPCWQASSPLPRR